MSGTPPDKSFRTGMWAGGAAVLLVGAIVAALGMLLRPTTSPGEMAVERAAAAQAQADKEQAQAQAQALRGQLVAADAELAVERAARRALEDNLAALQTQAGQLRDRVAFYDQLFPAGPDGTVSIRAVEITRVPSGLRYRVLLMRSARPGLAPFAGGLQFIATGTRGGVPAKLPLAPLQTPAPASTSTPTSAQAQEAAQAPAAAQAQEAAQAQAAAPESTPSSTPAMAGIVPLEVDQYRSSEGILALPPDFTPTEVSVDVVQNGTVLASQQAAVAF